MVAHTCTMYTAHYYTYILHTDTAAIPPPASVAVPPPSSLASQPEQKQESEEKSGTGKFLDLVVRS